MADVRRLESLTRDESLRLLQSVSLGRVVFTHLALPAIRPVNHLVEGDEIIIRMQRGAAVATVAGMDGSVVAYEADVIDPDDHLGWSVVVVGRARSLPEGQLATRYRQALSPWVTGAHDDIVTIQADMVDGFRVVRAGAAPAFP